jgi:carboxyl-terminal processing protease
VNGALRGMLDNLDAHSNYLDPDDYSNLQAETSGQFGGVGIELGLVDDFFTVIAPLDDTPASAAGLQSGDRITKIDDQTLRGKKLMEVVKLLRGEPGSTLQLRIVREETTPFNVTLTRATIEIASVKGHLIEPGYGYIRISQFQSRTSEDFARQLKDLIRDNKAALDGLVLDLRNNPGGVLQASVAVADTFLEDGLIVYTEGRLPTSRLKYRASGKDVLDGAPIVVLINEGSASAAEIVAGALQDHKRAKLVGTKSYGKGSVQSVMPLSGNRAIKLTTAYYYTPEGRSIQKIGIEPDILVEFSVVTADHYDEVLMARALAVLKEDSADGLHARL